MRALACFALVAGCGGVAPAPRGPALPTPTAMPAVVAGGEVFIPYRRYFTREVEGGPGFIGSFFVGAAESAPDTTVITRIDDLGTVVVNLVDGSCRLAAGVPPPDTALPFTGELDPARPPALPAEGSLLALGAVGRQAVYRHSHRALLFVFDASTKRWREIAFGRCSPP